MATYPILISQLDLIINLFNYSEDFQNFFIHKLEMIYNFINMQVNWRIAIIFFDKIIKIEVLFEKTIFTTKLYDITMKFLLDENSNVRVKTAVMKAMPYLLKFCKKSEKDEIIRYIEKEVIESKSFYKRRLYFPFFEESIKVFCIASLLNYQIIDYVLKFFNDNKLMQAKLIKILKYFYPLIFTEMRIKFIINSKLDNLRKMGNFDYELTRVKFLNFIVNLKLK